MQMRMVQQILSPGVQDGEEADLGAEALGIGGNGLQGLGAGLEEDFIHRLFIGQRQLV
jgi:hypothetical protein